jgi:hypothetical protein
MHFSPCTQHLCVAISDLWFTRKPEDPEKKAPANGAFSEIGGPILINKEESEPALIS